jgi:hypothetical protein
MGSHLSFDFKQFGYGFAGYGKIGWQLICFRASNSIAYDLLGFSISAERSDVILIALSL